MNVDLRAIGRKVLHEFGLRAERLLAMMWISRPRDWEAITWAKLEEVVLSRRQRELKGELLSHGYMYMSIQWNKVVTDRFGAKVPNDGLAHNRLCFGTIERGSDAWEIMRDAGRFLKNPTLTGLPAGANQPMAVGAVIGTGYSQTGALANEFMIRARTTTAAARGLSSISSPVPGRCLLAAYRQWSVLRRWRGLPARTNQCGSRWRGRNDHRIGE